MKFIVGEPPIDKAFNPVAEGWIPLIQSRFFPSYFLNTLGPLFWGSIFLLFINLLLEWLTGQGFFDDSVYEYYLPMVFSFVCIPLAHEMLRILAIPVHKDDMNVVMPSNNFLWIGISFVSELARNRLLMILALPFLALSALPVFISLISGINSVWLSVPAFVNGLASSADAVLILHLLRKTAKDSPVLVNGLNIYYKMGKSQTKGV